MSELLKARGKKDRNRRDFILETGLYSNGNKRYRNRNVWLATCRVPAHPACDNSLHPLKRRVLTLIASIDIRPWTDRCIEPDLLHMNS